MNESRRQILLDTPHTETATGAIASFETDMVGRAKEVKVEIDPVQDLHGYDNPWPAGGGNNVWDEEWEVGAYNTTTGQKVAGQSRQIRSKNLIPVTPGAAYYIKNGGTDYYWFLFFDAGKNVLTSGLPSGKNQSANARAFANQAVTMPSDCAYVAFYTQTAYGATYKNDIAINYPATVTTYSPYSNICPISGWTGANVEATGKNLWGGTAFMALADNWTGAVTNTTDMTVTGKISNLTTRAKVFEYPFKANTRYTIFMQASVNNTGLYVVYTDGTEASISTPVYVTNATKTVSYLRFYISTSSGITFYTNGIGVFEGDVAQADFVPYTGSTIPISWANEAGTVYGGYLTWLWDGTVKLTKTRVLYNLQSFSGVFGVTNNGYAVYRTMPRSRDWSATSNVFRWSASSYTQMPIGTFGGGSGVAETWSFILPSSITSIAEANAWLQNNPTQICYRLLTPVTYTLTPQQALVFLRGTNSVWNDINDTTVTYWTHKTGDSV